MARRRSSIPYPHPAPYEEELPHSEGGKPPGAMGPHFAIRISYGQVSNARHSTSTRQAMQYPYFRPNSSHERTDPLSNPKIRSKSFHHSKRTIEGL
ncbi:hypothetical protein NL676_027101 [Syzygium grande]|nr:hypothetical protein NL676_027101 [Syzygium grande]